MRALKWLVTSNTPPAWVARLVLVFVLMIGVCVGGLILVGLSAERDLAYYEFELEYWEDFSSRYAVSHFPRSRSVLPDGSLFYSKIEWEREHIALYVPGAVESARTIAELHSLSPVRGAPPPDDFVALTDRLEIDLRFDTPEAIWGVVNRTNEATAVLWIDLSTGERLYGGFYDGW